FFNICQKSINPEITLLDIQEMIIQHILTEDIFINIFSESQFHQENNVARELQGVISTFFTGSLKRNTLGSIERYYAVIRRTAANIVNHQEKQKFLKALYENFYKAYNPKAADRLGIVYTPNEIVRFMIESTDFLVHKHFGKLLADKDVEILDPATGTGTFITELIDYLPSHSLQHKYKYEIHCNEVAILPYYIANLNIEYTYKQKMGVYEEFENICFVDTLDNTSFEGKQMDLFAMTLENTARIKRQNDRTISVIIGNPPYNANQANENDNNKNRAYSEIDKLIKATYVKESTAQKTKLYDMYSRFFRWATVRLNENGVLAFITNSSFIKAKTFDGFRKVVSQDFSEIYIIDLGGDVRVNPKLSGTKNNVFGIQTGVAISFMVKKKTPQQNPCKIFYTCRPEFDTAEDKLKFLATNNFTQIHFQHIIPDNNFNWINLADTDFDNLLPLINKDTKNTKIQEDEKAVFKLFSLGIVTARDEWVYDFSEINLIEKVNLFCYLYEQEKQRWQDDINKDQINDFVCRSIKWTSELESHLMKKSVLKYDSIFIKTASYRPYIKQHFYYDKIIVHRLYQQDYIFKLGQEDNNMVICVNIGNKPFNVLVTNSIPDLHFTGDSQCLPLYRYDKEGNRIDNITDWGLKQIQTHYQDETITKIDIFHYTYAVLHNPAYRTKYELNLKREFPRLP
ncbi:MAG: type ISP restriction/modification enzyme, partial [Dolichospermum sp.]